MPLAVEYKVEATPNPIWPNATALVVFSGLPGQMVTWRLTGVGTLTNADAFTDERGIAKAIFTPSAPNQTCTVEVDYVS